MNNPLTPLGLEHVCAEFRHDCSIEETFTSQVARIIEELVTDAMKRLRSPPALKLLERDPELHFRVYVWLRLLLHHRRVAVYHRNVFATFYAESLIKRLQDNQQIIEALHQAFPGEVVDVNDTRDVGNPFVIRMSLFAFIEYTADVDNALVNAAVTDGYVYMSLHEAARILQEAVKQHFLRRVEYDSGTLSLIASDEFIGSSLERLTTLMNELDEPPVHSKFYYAGDAEKPPCVTDLLSRLATGHNLTHNERFFLSRFLIKIGWGEQQIVEAFSASPDFSESITRSQVARLMQDPGRMPHSCKTLRSIGICKCDCGVKNPVVWMMHQERRRRYRETQEAREDDHGD